MKKVLVATLLIIAGCGGASGSPLENGVYPPGKDDDKWELSEEGQRYLYDEWCDTRSGDPEGYPECENPEDYTFRRSPNGYIWVS